MCCQWTIPELLLPAHKLAYWNRRTAIKVQTYISSQNTRWSNQGDLWKPLGELGVPKYGGASEMFLWKSYFNGTDCAAMQLYFLEYRPLGSSKRFNESHNLIFACHNFVYRLDHLLIKYGEFKKAYNCTDEGILTCWNTHILTGKGDVTTHSCLNVV